MVWICLALAVGTAALAVALAVLSRRAAALAEREQQAASLQRENRELRNTARQLTEEVETLRRQLSASSPEAESRPSGNQKAALPSSTLSALRGLGQLRQDLAGAKTTIDQLRSRILDLESELEQVKGESSSLASREKELEEKLSWANRLIAAMQSELKGKTSQLTPLQMSNRSLREENQQIKEKNGRISSWADQLEDINRRRESYLTNILRRYRDLTEQYRSMAARMENPGEAQPPSGAEITRIGDAISMAEDDLRQISSLNARAERLQKQITKD